MAGGRGRPKMQMTQRRCQVLGCVTAYRERGALVSLSRIARECGLHSNSDVRRIVDDLKMMGVL
jgi:DNA-binding IclR family transcriptional regulator